MGLRAPKSLIEVKPGRTFLDVIARQTEAAGLPLVLMNSAASRVDGVRDFLQGREPKLWADTHAPVDWPADPALEWCPAGHGDVYVALEESGMLATLRGEGVDWAFISNADNLGAIADARIPAWAEAQGVPFVMEVVRGTAADRKGGHLALHRRAPGAARDRAGARGRRLVRRRRALALLQHQQPLGRPARARTRRRSTCR